MLRRTNMQSGRKCSGHRSFSSPPVSSAHLRSFVLLLFLCKPALLIVAHPHPVVRIVNLAVGSRAAPSRRVSSGNGCAECSLGRWSQHSFEDHGAPFVSRNTELLGTTTRMLVRKERVGKMKMVPDAGWPRLSSTHQAGRTPLMCAAQKGCFEVVARLLDAGARAAEIDVRPLLRLPHLLTSPPPPPNTTCSKSDPYALLAPSLALREPVPPSLLSAC